MIVYRLCKAKYSHDLTGSGAEKTGSRWNSRGIPMVYTSESRALCISEIAMHMPLGILPDDYEIVSLDLPGDISIHRIREQELPPDWKLFPHAALTRKLGDALIRQNKHLILKAPSAVVRGDYNYLINPRHKDSYKVKILRVEAFDLGRKTSSKFKV
jgi:RES domain-containing protein